MHRIVPYSDQHEIVCILNRLYPNVFKSYFAISNMLHSFSKDHVTLNVSFRYGHSAYRFWTHIEKFFDTNVSSQS